MTILLGTYFLGITNIYYIYINYGGDVMREYGTIRINLKDLLEKRGLSKNKLSQRAEMQRTQINNYCNNKITRLDTDVLARLCTVLECEISDLLEFVPPQEK